MSENPRWIERYRILAYVVIAYAFTWGLGGVVITSRYGLLEAPAWLHFVAAYGPLVGASVITAWADGPSGLRDLLNRLVRVQFKPVWWLAILSPALLAIAVALGVWLVTGSPLPLSDFGEVEGIGQVGIIKALLLWVVTFGLGEETGWRGFLQHHLDRQSPSRNNSLVVGLIWAAWHIPFFFYQDNYITMGLLGTFGWFMGVMAGAVFLAWIYQGTGASILAVVIWHAVFNLFSASPASVQLIAPLLSVGVIAAAIVIRNVQHRQEKAQRA